MKDIIKKPFKPRGILMALCVILLCVSCKKDEKPDKVIENVSGTLHYREEFKMWYVIYGIPGSVDAHEIYFILKMPGIKFPFEEYKQVTISGYCYKVPESDLEKISHDFLMGTEYYYIKITDLK